MLLDVDAPYDFVIKRYLRCTVFVNTGSNEARHNLTSETMQKHVKLTIYV